MWSLLLSQETGENTELDTSSTNPYRMSLDQYFNPAEEEDGKGNKESHSRMAFA